MLGAELRAARKAAGISTSTLGSRLGRSHTHISRWENGRLTPREADVGAVLGILGITGAERERLLGLAREAGDPNWVAPGVDKQLTVLMEYERTARRIVDVEPLLIPGLLQTAEYARAIMLGSGTSRGEADKRVTYRLGRRDILTRKRPVELHAYIGEQALRYAPCEPEVMLDQLRHLRQWAGHDHVVVRAIPLGQAYSPALEGAFVLLEFDRDRPVGHLEHYRSSTTITDTRDVGEFRKATDMLDRTAMGEDATSKLITEIINEVEGR